MEKRFTWIFLAVTGAFFLFTIGFTAYRIEDARGRNAAAARERASELVAKVQSLESVTGGYDAPQFKTDMRDLFSSERHLVLLCIHSPDGGIAYLVAASKTILVEPADITPDWRGTPRYRVNRGNDLLVSSPLDGGGQNVTMDALFVIMGRDDLYAVLRDDLYLFLAFLLVCGVVILIVMSVQPELISPRAPAASAPSARASGPGGAAGPVEPMAAPETPSMAAAPGSRESPQQSDRALTSPRSGLVWAEYLEPRLKAELERASASDQDISLAKLRIDEPFADAKLPLVFAAISKMLLDSFPLHDLIFETGNESYTVLLPDSDVDASVRSLEDFRKKVAAASIEGKNRSVSIGVSSRGGRLIDGDVLVKEADTALAKASREGGNQVIGFRADAARFRQALSASRT